MLIIASSFVYHMPSRDTQPTSQSMSTPDEPAPSAAFCSATAERHPCVRAHLLTGHCAES